jgi:Raf kinase inhibitor-like YbhB/YbcL family protein
MRRLPLLAAAAAALLAGCGGGDKASEPLPEASGKLQLTSPAFDDGGTMAKKYSCDGDEVSPPLSWSGVPSGAKELALVMEDPDADHFVHWTVLKIPPGTSGFEEDKVPAGAVQTENTFGKRGYGGPCPPEGDDPHHYVFALYALRRPLGLGEDASPDEVRDAVADDALASGELTGRFGR